MAIFFTSDCHFNHANIIKYEPVTRPFDSIQSMNEEIVKNWNAVVSEEDTIYVIGDFFLGSPKDIDPILSRLNGHIILIRGNHDTPKKIAFYQSRGIEVKELEYLSYKGLFFILCHFPLVNQEFFDMLRGKNSEVILLYGHVHSKAPTGLYNGTYHIGVDTNNLTPVSLDTIYDAVKSYARIRPNE